MYECYNLKRFIRLLMLDAIIFGLCLIFFFIGKRIILTFADNSGEERVFLPVIMYHSIAETSPGKYVVTPEQVESDLKYLKDNGYTSVTAQQLVDYTNGCGELPEKPVLITLDDGFYNNLYYLLPLLEKYDMYAIVSVVGAYTDNNAVADPHVPGYSYLTWEDINQLLESGRFEIGNHTYDMHSSDNGRKGCSKNSGETCEEYSRLLNEDISLLQSEMLENTGTLPFVFAYPYSYISQESLPVLHENGFLMTLNCYERPNYIIRDPECLYGINRYNRSGAYSTEEFMSLALSE